MSISIASTLPAQLEQRITDAPGRDFIAVGGGWLTAEHVRDRAQRLATGLYALGVRPGDRVASIMANRIEAVELLFACAELGAVSVPLNIYLRGEFLRYQLTDCDPSLLIVDAAAQKTATAMVGETGLATRLVALDGRARGVAGFTDLFIDPDPVWPAPEPDTLMSILYTSGTTGLPKGCMITHGYMLHWPKAHLMFEWFKPSDTSISTLPLYHGFGASGLMSTLAGGGRIRFEPEFRAGTLIDRARETGATQLWAVGAIGAALLATPPGPGDKDHSLERCVFIPMSPEAQGRFEERFGVQVLAEGYGQTEVLPATMGGVRTGRDLPSAGRAVPWLDVAVVDDGDGVLPAGRPGEIVVRPLEPNSIFAGYWRKEAATLESWRNLWHHTGDLGYFDADGMLYFVDRKKDALRRRGENVSSVELETAILKHADIAQVAVHAVPSELSEDEIKACLVLEPGALLEPAELFRYFRDSLPYYAIPRYVELMDELPVNAVGRVLKHKLRDRWDAPGTIDFQSMGLVIDKSTRR
ncbi:AMP-binding protein [Actinomadura napierensis]|uniref:ATP-dependent acyl-CoA ligase n=1 Tax=Actinomadura napierensis TaxID=267854 RepID=A0ABN2ZSI3_9ACTN